MLKRSSSGEQFIAEIFVLQLKLLFKYSALLLEGFLAFFLCFFSPSHLS